MRLSWIHASFPCSSILFRVKQPPEPAVLFLRRERFNGLCAEIRIERVVARRAGDDLPAEICAVRLHRPALFLIAAEAEKGAAGRIAIKVNSMNDIGVMLALIRASRAGVRVELFIRGICCLRPGVPGYTENIAVRSVVGRYLEHSRIFAFGEGTEQRIFIGSGDLLNRNTRRRVEAFIECVTPETREGVLAILDALRADREKSWTMQPDGSYSRAETVPGTASHDTLYEYFGEKTVEPLPPEKKHGWLWRLFHPNKKKLHGNEA